MKKHEHNNSCSSCETSKHHNYELILYFIGLFIFIISLFVSKDVYKLILIILVLILSGFHVILGGIKDTILSSFKHKRFKPNVHILMTIAAIGALIIGKYSESAILILIFAGAHFLEEYAENKSRKEITSLINLNPTTARLLDDDGKTTIINVDTINVGDKLLVLSGDQIPTDGILIKGNSTVDQAVITGESIPVDKFEGDSLYGGTQNGNGIFVMEATIDSSKTIINKIVLMVTESQQNISKSATLIKKIEPIYVTLVILLAPIFYLLGIYLFTWSVDESFYRTMVFLIGASPCALAATDIPASLSAISNLAKRKVLFKGSSYLANVADLKVIAFDKTGTITNGKPVVTDVYYENNLVDDKKKMFQSIIVSMEQKANHPLANAIVSYFNQSNKLELEVENKTGVGLHSTYDNKEYFIGKPTSFKNVSKDFVDLTNKLENSGKTVIYFGSLDVHVLIALQDIAKDSSKDAISYFNSQKIKTVMLTGDSINTGNAIAKNVGVSDVIANILPDQKANYITGFQTSTGITAMIGDGINDAPALAIADIGIAMGMGSDLAIETADAVIIDNDLTKFVYAHQISKKLKRIVIQNALFAFSVIIFLTIMNIFGLMDIAIAVVIHEGSTFLVILNGLRMLLPIRSKKINK